MIVIQAVSAFGKMTESTLFRLTSISGKKIVLAILLYAVIYLLIFELIGSIFIWYFYENNKRYRALRSIIYSKCIQSTKAPL